jgi:hypothetical protein
MEKLHPGCEALYQHPTPSWSPGNSWYLSQPVGIRKLKNMMSRLSVEADLSQRYTNHCLRATCITTLMRSGLDPITVTRLSGHRNPASVMSYCRDATDDTKRQMGNILTSSLSGSHHQIEAPSSTAGAVPATTSCRPAIAAQQVTPELPASTISRPPTAAVPSGSMIVQANRQDNAMSSMFDNCSVSIGTVTVHHYGPK